MLATASYRLYRDMDQMQTDCQEATTQHALGWDLSQPQGSREVRQGHMWQLARRHIGEVRQFLTTEPSKVNVKIQGIN